MLYIIILIVGIILGLIPYFTNRHKRKKFNTELLKAEQQLEEEIKLKREAFNAEQEMYLTAHEELKKKLDIEHKDIVKAHEQEIETMKADKEQYTKKLEQEKQEAENRFALQLEQIAKKYQQDEEACSKEYLKALEEATVEYNLSISTLNHQKEVAEAEYKKLKQMVNTATEAAVREEKKKKQIDFYKLQIPEKDLKTIKKLREVEVDLDDTLALNKAIWKIYYEKPYTDLVGRVIGDKPVSGIYKITNLENQMCYVGQSVDLADRWKQHLKRGIGAETPTRNKLYPAMMSTGVENFTFEVVEICPKEELNEKEKIWQNYFNAMSYGYSMR